MSKLVITGNNQFTLYLNRPIVRALGWDKGDELLVSKAAGQNYIIVEKVAKSESEKHGAKI
jgi:bifunctional DNA-binding transcriptional regulator/antitoxin component of YhaV-PrlF toxin-antitoxin module